MIDEPNIAAPKISGSRTRSFSLAWLVPIAALVVALAIAWRHYADQGPLIEIHFDSASGLEAGSSKIKHRDVEIGTIEAIRFADDVDGVIAQARMKQEIEPYLNETTQFWIVKPRVQALSITGLDTVLSGTYVQMEWGASEGTRKRSFDALEDPPPTPLGTPGIRLRLRSEAGGSINPGAPVFYKRIEVGRAETKELTEDGTAVEFLIFINAPYDKLINQATRFWNASGFDVELGADGARLRMESLVSLIEGGIAFDTVAEFGAWRQAEENDLYLLYPAEKAARESLFAEDPFSAVRVSIIFDASVRGLNAGAPVEYRGVRVGEVVDVSVGTVTEDGLVEIITTITLNPERIGVTTADPEMSLTFLEAAVRRGLRAQLGRANLLTGALYVNLVDAPNAPQATLDRDAEPYPRMPHIPTQLDTLTESVTEIVENVRKLPFERIGDAAAETAENLASLTGSSALQGAPGQVGDILTRAQEVMEGVETLPLERIATATALTAENLASLTGSEGLQGAPVQIGDLLARAQGVLDDIDALPLDRIGTAAAQTAENLAALTGSSGAQGAPRQISEILEQVQTVLAGIAELPLDRLAVSAADAADAAATVLNDPGVQDLPEEIAAFLQALRAIPYDEIGVAVARAADQAAVAAEGAAALLGAEEVRQIPRRIDALVSRVEDLPIEEIGTSTADAVGGVASLVNDPATAAIPQQISTALTRIDAILATPGVQNAPAQISAVLYEFETLLRDPALRNAATEAEGALRAIRGIVEDLRTAQAPLALTAALDSANMAARAVENFTVTLPPLAEQLRRTASQIESSLASVSPGTTFYYETLLTIREIRDAARSVADLSETLEYKPNSLILGK